jgi:hypothetical protein
VWPATTCVGPGEAPVFSHTDGRRIGFTLCRKRCNIYTMRPNGTDVVQIMNTGRFKEFDDWGPSPLTP